MNDNNQLVVKQTCGTSTETQLNGGTIVSREIKKYSQMSTINR